MNNNETNQLDNILSNNILEIVAKFPFCFYDQKTIAKGIKELESITRATLESIPNLKVSPYSQMMDSYETKIEFIKPYKFNIIIDAKQNMLSNEKKETELENNFKERLNKPFILSYDGKFLGVRITDYSRDENTHVAHVVIPERYLV